jgi:hypothetical protein
MQCSPIDPGGSVKLRKHSRFAVQLPALYTAENIQCKGVVFNLSAEGCAIGGSRIMPKGAYLALQLSLSDQSSMPIEVELGAVRWSTERQFGVEFIRLKDEDSERLRTYAQLLQIDT